MAKKNISGLFDQALTLTDDEGRDWVLRPPNKQRGLQIAVLYAGLSHLQKSGGQCKACGHTNLDGLDHKTQAVWEQLQDREFEEVVLGRAVYDQMVEADVSATAMHWIATYAMWFWTLGEATADLLATAYEESRNGNGGADTDPKADATLSLSKSGPSTA